MPTAYPIEIVNRAKTLWLERTSTGKLRSFREVAELMNRERGTKLAAKTVHQWSQEYGWTQGESTELVPVGQPPASPLPIRIKSNAPTQLDSDERPDWDWEREKVKFLADLAGIARDCLAAVRNEEGKPEISFRDAESAAKTGLACLEAVGKINAGKYDTPEAGDRLPALKETDVEALIVFFSSKGKRPAPDIHGSDGLVIDVESEPTE